MVAKVVIAALAAVLVLQFATFSVAVSGLTGACKSQNYTVADIDLSRFTGAWYEVAHSSSFYWDRGCQCTTAEYSAKSDGTVRVLNSCRLDTVNGKLFQKEATARVITPGKNGRLTVNFGIPGADAPYDVIMTGTGADYEYAVIASCSPFPVFGGSNIWIISRTPSFDDDLYKILFDKITEMGFDTSDLVRTVQDKCWAFDATDAIIDDELASSGAVSKQCTNPSSISNFDLERFLGTWYLIYDQADFTENIFTHDCTCATSTLTRTESGIQTVQACNLKTVDGTPSKAVGSLNEFSNLTSRLGYFSQKIHGISENWQVISVDESYDSALLFNCFDYLISRTYCLYILSKNPTLPEETVTQYMRLADNLGILNKDSIRKIEQDGCTRS